MPDTTSISRLHPQVMRWVAAQRWPRLRDIQEEAIAPILAGHDVIIAAGTASGKTEAAWLPVLSRIMFARDSQERDGRGVRAIYISPIKALINDQAERLERMCADLEVNIVPWHGDVSSSTKRRLGHQDSILLITPESIEAMFVRRGEVIGPRLAAAEAVIVDELHSFLGYPRGAQLRSLLDRLDLAARHRTPRIGLSATIGDPAAARAYLRPRGGESVIWIQSRQAVNQLRVVLKGYLEAAEPAHDGDDAQPPASAMIANDLYVTLRGSDNLVFANGRRDVEIYTDRLNKLCQRHQVPAAFVPHHGSLSKDIREHTERRLKDPTTPTTAVCTSTLEMGIDIGSVAMVAQIGSPISVAGLKQRVGRSGRRAGEHPTLRMYVAENPPNLRTPPQDELRTELVQSIAAIELLLRGWSEAPDMQDQHLSTLIQQILSIIAQYSGARPKDLYQTLSGAFAQVDESTFIQLLRSMKNHDLIVQDSSGSLLPGVVGEQLIDHYSFYSAFTSEVEFRVIHGGKTLGSMPVASNIRKGSLIIFAGRRWSVSDVDERRQIIEVREATGARPPRFGGVAGDVADRVRLTMRQLYRIEQTPTYVDDSANTLLAEGRAAYRRYGLDETFVIEHGGGTILLPWRGDRTLRTMSLALTRIGYAVGVDGVALTIKETTTKELVGAIAGMLELARPSAIDLAREVVVRERDKYDRYLDEDLLLGAVAARSIDVNAAWEAFGEVSGGRGPALPRLG